MSSTRIQWLQEQLTEAKNKLKLWQAAEEAVIKGGQSYSLKDGDMDRQLTRVNSSEIHSMIIYYSNRVQTLMEAVDNGGKIESRVIFGRGV